MSGRVAVVGSNGRVGRAICEVLRGSFEVVPIVRDRDESVESIAQRATHDADLVVNAAGVAHVERPTAADLERLQIGNVELPLALARWCLERRLPLVHVSSVKAADPQGSSPYAASKREAERRLDEEFGDAFESAGLPLILVRPLALLFPPFDAGKLRRLRLLRHAPALAVPPVPLPVLAPDAFLDEVETVLASCFGGSAPSGLAVRDFDRSHWATLRDIKRAFAQSQE